MSDTLGEPSDIRVRAIELLRSRSLQVILGSDEPLRIADITRSIAENLDLNLGGEELGGLASVVRLVLDSDPIFAQTNRQWDLALRMGRAEADRRKPVERAFADFIDLLGQPALPTEIAALAAAVYGRTPDYYIGMLSRIAPDNRHLFRVGREHFGVRSWLLDIGGGNVEDVEFDNFEETEALEQVRSYAEGQNADDPIEYAQAILDRAAAPVANKELQFVVWSRFPNVTPAALVTRLYQAPTIHMERGPFWCGTEEFDRLLGALRSLAQNPSSAGDIVSSSGEEDAPAGILSPTTIRVSDDDLDQVFNYMSHQTRAYSLGELCQQALEAFPGSRTYQAVYDSLFQRLREDSRFQWVGFTKFRLAGTIPSEVEVLPPGLALVEQEFLDGEEEERILEPREWKANLEQQVADLRLQDVGDDSTISAPAPDFIQISVPMHHYVAGTRYLRHSERNFFPTEPDLVQVMLRDAGGNSYEAWINNRMGILFGLKEWYEANLPWVGGVYQIQHGENPDEYLLVNTGESEPEMDIQMPRLQTLVQLRSIAVSEAMSLFDIVQRLVKEHPEGASLVTLFTEVNVVRRTQLAQLASVLSHRLFTFANGVWSFDEKRATKTKGKKKPGPRRPSREAYDEDDDDEFEYE